MADKPQEKPIAKPDLKWHPDKRPVPVKTDRGEFGFK